MNDAKIRYAIHSQLIRNYHRSKKAIIVDELGIHHGRSRVDIAVINCFLYGFEIKSELDDLSRLPGQVDAYNSVFNKITLVMAEKFRNQVADMIPE